jgi:hypothetical protein
MILFGWSIPRRSASLAVLEHLRRLGLHAGAWPMTAELGVAAPSKCHLEIPHPRGHCQTIPFPHTTKHKHLQNGTRRTIRIGLLLLTNQTGSTELRRHPDAARCTFTKATPLPISTLNRTDPTIPFAHSHRMLAYMYGVTEARSAGMMGIQDTELIPGNRQSVRRRRLSRRVRQSTSTHESRYWVGILALREGDPTYRRTDGTLFTRTSR